ncbi:MAG: fasciclin domain-containing protein [Pseudomonadota bacterium]
MKFTKTLIAASSALVLATACSSGDDPEVTVETPPATETPATETPEVTETTETTELNDIVVTARENGSFNTLVAAVRQAGLVSTLRGEGPFTVFAPTDDAFGAVDSDTLSSLMMDENKDTLTAILTYHVVAGKVDAAGVVAAITDGGGSAELTTVQGGTLTASLDGDAVVLTDVAGNAITVVATDVEATNGVIHVIDGVLMPQ